tara:strand:+ start:445 stop:603 length:159 start_codon:yes stop_codon:yes gene_type:complete
VLKPPFLRNNNGSQRERVRIDGRDAYINQALFIAKIKMFMSNPQQVKLSGDD